MLSRVWTKLARVLAGSGAVALLAVGAVRADDSELKSLRERLERLEQQNQELQKKVDHRGGEESEAAPGAGVNADDVKKIVGDYIKDQDKKKKTDEDKKKKDQEEMGYEVGKDTTFKAFWKDGLFFETGDKAFKFHVGGRVDFDNGWYNAPNNINRLIDPTSATTSRGFSDGSAFRRARIRLDGTCWEVFDFMTEYEFASAITGTPGFPGGDPVGAITGVSFRDFWVAINEVPFVGTIRMGKQKEMLTFANSTSSRFLTFIERPYIFDAFVNDNQFSDGIALYNTYCDDRYTSAVGVFRNSTQTTGAQIGDGEYVADARATALLYYADEGREWVHIGASGSLRTLHFDSTRFRVRPLVFSGIGTQIPNILNTGNVLSASGQEMFGLEFASVFNRFTLTGEYFASRVDNAFTGGLPGAVGGVAVPRGNLFYQGWYAEALCFLTPDYRGYNRKGGAYDRIKPLENMFFVKSCDGYLFGRGAWEVGVRWDHIDLADGINNSPNAPVAARTVVGAGPNTTGNTNGAAAVASTIPANFGGNSDAVTFGLNWHLNPNMKIQFNYIWTYLNYRSTPQNSGSFDTFGVRLHWDF